MSWLSNCLHQMITSTDDCVELCFLRLAKVKLRDSGGKTSIFCAHRDRKMVFRNSQSFHVRWLSNCLHQMITSTDDCVELCFLRLAKVKLRDFGGKTSIFCAHRERKMVFRNSQSFHMSWLSNCLHQMITSTDDCVELCFLRLAKVKLRDFGGKTSIVCAHRDVKMVFATVKASTWADCQTVCIKWSHQPMIVLSCAFSDLQKSNCVILAAKPPYSALTETGRWFFATVKASTSDDCQNCFASNDHINRWLCWAVLSQTCKSQIAWFWRQNLHILRSQRKEDGFSQQSKLPHELIVKLFASNDHINRWLCWAVLSQTCKSQIAWFWRQNLHILRSQRQEDGFSQQSKHRHKLIVKLFASNDHINQWLCWAVLSQTCKSQIAWCWRQNLHILRSQRQEDGFSQQSKLPHELIVKLFPSNDHINRWLCWAVLSQTCKSQIAWFWRQNLHILRSQRQEDGFSQQSKLPRQMIVKLFASNDHINRWLCWAVLSQTCKSQIAWFWRQNHHILRSQRQEDGFSQQSKLPHELIVKLFASNDHINRWLCWAVLSQTCKSQIAWFWRQNLHILRSQRQEDGFSQPSKLPHELIVKVFASNDHINRWLCWAVLSQTCKSQIAWFWRQNLHILRSQRQEDGFSQQSKLPHELIVKLFASNDHINRWLCWAVLSQTCKSQIAWFWRQNLHILRSQRQEDGFSQQSKFPHELIVKVFPSNDQATDDCVELCFLRLAKVKLRDFGGKTSIFCAHRDRKMVFSQQSNLPHELIVKLFASNDHINGWMCWAVLSQTCKSQIAWFWRQNLHILRSQRQEDGFLQQSKLPHELIVKLFASNDHINRWLCWAVLSQTCKSQIAWFWRQNLYILRSQRQEDGFSQQSKLPHELIVKLFASNDHINRWLCWAVLSQTCKSQIAWCWRQNLHILRSQRQEDGFSQQSKLPH